MGDLKPKKQGINNMGFIQQLFEHLGPLAIFVLIFPLILILSILRMVGPLWPIALAFIVVVGLGIVVVMALKKNSGKIGRGPLGNVP